MTRVRKGECRPSWKCSNVKVKASDFKISLVDPPLNRYWLESRLGSSISGPVPRKRSTTCNWSCTFQGASLVEPCGGTLPTQNSRSPEGDVEIGVRLAIL